jgi:THO complex subunit 2 N-terminus
MPWNLSDPRNAVRAPVRTVLTDATLQGIVTGKIVPSDAAATVPGITRAKFAGYALDCLWAVMEGDMEAEVFPRAIRASGPQDARSNTLAYVFLVAWADVEGPNRDAFSLELRDPELDTPLRDPQALKVAEAVAACRKEELVTTLDLYEVLDVRLLQQLGLTGPLQQAPGKQRNFTNRLAQTRVQNALKISIYNTFREETEGFAKLVTLLNNSALAALADAAPVSREVDQLIGYYKLAPLKVAFCVLCALESNPASAPVRARPRACFRLRARVHAHAHARAIALD